MLWRDAFEKGKELVVATCSPEATPNANIVVSCGFIDNKLLVSNCQMATTISNIEKTKLVCIVSAGNKGYYRIKGNCEVFESGKYVEACEVLEPTVPVKSAILITITDVFDLDKVEKLPTS